MVTLPSKHSEPTMEYASINKYIFKCLAMQLTKTIHHFIDSVRMYAILFKLFLPADSPGIPEDKRVF